MTRSSTLHAPFENAALLSCKRCCHASYEYSRCSSSRDPDEQCGLDEAGHHAPQIRLPAMQCKLLVQQPAPAAAGSEVSSNSGNGHCSATVEVTNILLSCKVVTQHI
jgi:hypothetical protein